MERIRIGEVLDRCDREIYILQCRVDRLKQQKKGLMQQLLTGKIRIKVDAETVEV